MRWAGGEEEDEAAGVDEGAVEGLGGGGAGLAGAAAAAEHLALVFGEEELLLPGVGVHALGAEDFRGVEGEAELGGGVHGCMLPRPSPIPRRIHQVNPASRTLPRRNVQVGQVAQQQTSPIAQLSHLDESATDPLKLHFQCPPKC